MKNDKYKSKRFLIPILSLVLISIVSIAIISTYISIEMFKSHMNESIKQTTEEYTQKHKKRVYEDVTFVDNAIKYQITTIEDKLKAYLEEKVKVALNVATFTYNKYKDTHTKEEIKKEIAKALSVIKFNENRSYYFMYDNKTKVIFGHPMQKFIGKDMTNFRDAKGRNLMKTDEEVLKNKNIAFNKIYFNKPDNQKEEFPKITCLAKFEPLDLILGLGEYLDVIEKRTKEDVLKRFSQIKYKEKDRYISIVELHNIKGGDEFGTVLLNSNSPKIVGKKVSDKFKDVKGNQYRKDFLKLLEEKGSGYSEYWYRKPSTNQPALKISYLHLQKDWNWIILSGFYYDNLEKKLNILKKSITTHTKNTIDNTIKWVVFLSILAIIIAVIVSIKIDTTIKKYTNTIIEYEDNKRKQEHLLIQQSKMAAMGEMIGNIAHQWRQPLSVISTSATGAKLQNEHGLLKKENINSYFDTINNTAQYLSQIIEDFRTFFNPKNDKVSEFYIENTIEKTLQLVNAQFTAKNIIIIKEIENYKLSSIENELIQVLINILNNARDALIKLENDEKLIFIKTYKSENDFIIEIKDNANGIEKEIINRVFEPYFTTKHKSQGTGIGLYMSEEIMKTRLYGEILVENETFNYKNSKYTGAKFIIKIKTQ